MAAQQQLHSADNPPPYPDEAIVSDLPSVPAGSPRHNTLPPLPALEPTPLLASSRNPLDQPKQDYHASANKPLDPFPSTTSTLQPLRLPNVPAHTPGEQPPRAQDASDDHMAAEVLCKLGKVDNPRVPSGYDTPLKYYPIGITHTPRPDSSSSEQQEPLLSLLTSSHPWLGGTVSSSVSAYSSTKSYTPRFIQYGADIVENTVGSVGRRSGVESSIRRYLGGRRPSELEKMGPEILEQRDSPSGAGDTDMMDVEKGSSVTNTPYRITSRGSVDSLPAYDENRSPAYEPNSPPQQLSTRPQAPRSWSTQLMISTSGLGAALSESSLRSLKYCLQVLGFANRHVRGLMESLKKLLQEYERSSPSPHRHSLEDGDPNAMAVDVDPKLQEGGMSNETRVIAANIKRLNDEIWKTLKDVCDKVSRYTGGALPENASVVVRWQLMSVPRRWQRAQQSSSSNGTSADGKEDPAVKSANRMMAFAIEGLDMMDQVGGVVESTIGSAERWLDSLGRKRKLENASDGPNGGAEAGYGDEKMDVVMEKGAH